MIIIEFIHTTIHTIYGIDRPAKKANRWKKDELTEFSISSSELGVTRYA